MTRPDDNHQIAPSERAPESPLTRAFAVLDYIAGQAQPVNVATLAEALGLPLPTAHRLVGNLEERGLLTRPLGSKRLVIGDRMLMLSAKSLAAGFHNAERHAVLQGLAAQIQQQCELGIVRDNVLIYIDSVRMRAPASLHFDPGVRAPLHCTSTGKLFIGHLPAKKRDRLVRALPLHPFTENTITDPERLLAESTLARQRGWATSNEEFVKGVIGCAVPIYGPRQTLLGGLGVSALLARTEFAALPSFIPALQGAATQLQATIETGETGAPELDAANC